MRLPKQVSFGSDRSPRKAWAPYNFVPLPEKVICRAGELPGHDAYDPDLLSGYFDVELETKSPTFVRAPISREDFDRISSAIGYSEDMKKHFGNRVANRPEFFHTGDPNRPVIPGSSLRGMLRSVVEIITYSKVCWVSDSKLVYRAVADRSALGNWYREQMMGRNRARNRDGMEFDYPSPNLRGGYLEIVNGKRFIRPAVKREGESFIHVERRHTKKIVKDGTKTGCYTAFVIPQKRAISERGFRGSKKLALNLALAPEISVRDVPGVPGACEASLIVTGSVGNRKHMDCAIWEPDKSAQLIPIPGEMWQAFIEDQSMTRGIEGRKIGLDGKASMASPHNAVFYLVNPRTNPAELVFFGPTMMFRLPYGHSPLSLIPKEIRDPEFVDYTEAIFGFTPEPASGSNDSSCENPARMARSGRVSVTDAVLANGQSSDGIWITGSDGKPLVPQILSSPKPTSFQNYLVQTSSSENDLHHYDSREGCTTIRGSKRYWHAGNPDCRALETADIGNGPNKAGTQNTQMRPVKAGVRFAFRVYFDNLTDVELGALCWALALGHASEADGAIMYCHSLGMGKPLGMGAVRLDAALHLIDRKARYQSAFAGAVPSGDCTELRRANWETGEVEPCEPLSDCSALSKRTEPFEKLVINKLGLESKAKRLSDVRRIACLLKLMEWPGRDIRTGAVCPESGGSAGGPGSRYMTPDDMRKRPVLPSLEPGVFGKLTGECEPESDST
jgi:CRISPR-associated protein (TIGR03986 family)